MKRATILFVAFFVLFLCACGASDEESRAAPSSSSEAAGAHSGEEQQEEADVSLQLVTGLYGVNSETVSEQGFYRFLSDSRESSESGSGNLLYTDFASRTEIVLCNRPDCMHSDESCTSWFPYRGGKLFMSADKTLLFCIASTGSMKDPQELWRMNPDGSEKTMLYQCGSGEDFTGVVASDGENLYLTVSSVGGLEHLDDAKTVLRIDSATGASEKVLPIDSNEWLRGAFDDRLVLETVEPDASRRYALYSLSTGQKTEIYSFEGEGLALAEDAFLYVLAKSGKEQADVLRVDLRTGEAATLRTGFPFFGWVMMDDIRDGKLRVSVSDTRANDPALVEHYQYWIDCETGEVTQTTLTYPWVETAQFVQVLAEYEDSFFVQRGVEYTPIMLTGTDGTAYETTSETPVYAMIAKSDYFANNPAYQDVTPASLPGA